MTLDQVYDYGIGDTRESTFKRQVPHSTSKGESPIFKTNMGPHRGCILAFGIQFCVLGIPIFLEYPKCFRSRTESG